MEALMVNIDFKQLGITFQKYIREEAIKANSTIVYDEGNFLIEEDPKTGEKKVLKEYKLS